jgi:hypothetical protein
LLANDSTAPDGVGLGERLAQGNGKCGDFIDASDTLCVNAVRELFASVRRLADGFDDVS